MVGNMSTRAGRVVALAALLAGICASMVLLPTTPAHAERYCWGAYLPGEGAKCHLDHERWATEVWGEGAQHSVCVWQQPYGPIKCSSGPEVWVLNYYGSNVYGVPYIEDHAPGATYAYGEVF